MCNAVIRSQHRALKDTAEAAMRIRADRRYPVAYPAVLVLVLGFALVACGVETGPGASTANTSVSGTSTTGTGATGTIAGDVVAGPTCPVQQAENPCPPRPVTGREVTITTPGGATIATTTTDANGHFSVAVAP